MVETSLQIQPEYTTPLEDAKESIGVGVEISGFNPLRDVEYFVVDSKTNKFYEYDKFIEAISLR